MGKIIVPNENGDSRWDFIPNPYVPALDVVVVDYFIAQSLCSRAATRPDVLVSIWDKDTDATERHEWLREMEAVENCLVIVLEFDDVPEDKHGYIAATAKDVIRLTDLALRLRTEQEVRQKVLVHCAAGISRSSASALTIFAGILGEGQEEVAVTALQEAIAITAQRGWRSVGIKPNSGVVAHADALLERKGKLISACTKVFVRKTVDPDAAY